MIGIGINENVYLASAELDQKGVLGITFEEAGAADKPKVDSLFDVIAAETVVETEYGMTIKMFPPLPPKEGNDRTEEKNVELLVSDINKTKGVLLHILRGYLTTDDIKKAGGLNPFRGLPITKENFNKEIQRKELLEGIHRNMCTDFVNLIRPFLGQKDKLFRLLLVRQSKDKHYASFRGKYIEDNPFFESMEIPKDASKVKFTKYELDNGLNDATPVKKDQAAAGDTAKGGDQPAPLTAANVFGGG
jgi:hypothetical protein